MLVVSLAAKTYGPSPFDHDLASVCLITATEEGVPLRSLQVDVRPLASPIYGPTYRVHPDYIPESFSLIDSTADTFAVADGKLVLFVIADLAKVAPMESISEESLKNADDMVKIIAVLKEIGRDKIITVTRQAHHFFPFIQRTLPVTYSLLSSNVIDIRSDELLQKRSFSGVKTTLFSSASSYLTYYTTHRHRNQDGEVTYAA